MPSFCGFTFPDSPTPVLYAHFDGVMEGCCTLTYDGGLGAFVCSSYEGCDGLACAVHLTCNSENLVLSVSPVDDGACNGSAAALQEGGDPSMGTFYADFRITGDTGCCDDDTFNVTVNQTSC